MRLYALTDATHVHDDDFGVFEVDPETRAVEIPDALGHRLHTQHINGQRVWEDDAQRAARIAEEESARRADPASLLAAMEELVAGQKDLKDAILEQVREEVKTLVAEAINEATAPAGKTDEPKGAPELTKAPAKKVAATAK